jgi:hypothetical protein
MTPEAAKTGERCSTHAGVPAVTHCADCHRPMCLVCAIPVRGRVLGVECLPDDAGPAGEDAAPPERSRRAAALAGLGSLAALATTAFPWTRFGTGSGAFGAWGTGRWSLLAAVASVAGLLAWAVARMRSGAPERAAGLVLAVTALGVVAGAGLAIVNGPPFTKPAATPWLCLAAGCLALAGGVAAAVRR